MNRFRLQIPVPLPGCCPVCHSDNTGRCVNLRWRYVSTVHVCREEECGYYDIRRYHLDFGRAMWLMEQAGLMLITLAVLWLLVSAFLLFGPGNAYDAMEQQQNTVRRDILPTTGKTEGQESDGDGKL